MLVLGLTGSIGMGKSTTAALFASRGVAVHDADAAVHALYRGAASVPIEAAFPGTVRDGAVDRAALGARVVGDATALAMVEAIVHPLVRHEENVFLGRAAAAGRRVVLLDIPLLLESGAGGRVDVIVVVSAPTEVQHARVLARPGMTTAKLDAILARQVPDAEKRRRAHAVIDTGRGVPAADAAVADLLRALAAGIAGGAGRRGLRQEAGHGG